MSVVFSSALRLHTSLPEMMSDGVITPTTAATTCCNPSGISWPAGGMPSYAKTLALLFVALICARPNSHKFLALLKICVNTQQQMPVSGILPKNMPENEYESKY